MQLFCDLEGGRPRENLHAHHLGNLWLQVKFGFHVQRDEPVFGVSRVFIIVEPFDKKFCRRLRIADSFAAMKKSSIRGRSIQDVIYPMACCLFKGI